MRLGVGKGFVVAADVLSLREPYCRNIDAYYKYTPITNTLTNPVQFGEYYPKKLSYAELSSRPAGPPPSHPRDPLSRRRPGLGRLSHLQPQPGTPRRPALLPLRRRPRQRVGARLRTAHVSPERVAEGRMSDVVDLDKVEIKIVPCLNPQGYDQRRRHNAAGVDLNRQGDHRWEEFQGRDSNEDGVWSAGDYDWKGTAPSPNPRAKPTRRSSIGPKTCTAFSTTTATAAPHRTRSPSCPSPRVPDNELRAMDLQQIANRRLARPPPLAPEPRRSSVSQYLLDTRPRRAAACPT